MTPELRAALRDLLSEYHLEEIEEIVRDEAKQDRAWEGLSGNHPRVQRFREICAILKASVR